jgi:UDP-2-acetamido-3-amino-2,3-dideoxy-glucuronate N-acetyltransferase
MIDASAFVHPLANVEQGATIGANTKVWQFATVRSGAVVGERCIIGQGAFVDSDVVVGNDCKLENYVSAHRGARIHDGVFLGPSVVLTNDHWPRATRPDGGLATEADWVCEPVTVARGASMGAGAIALPGVTIGEQAMVGSGSVVTRDVPARTVVAGNPARTLKAVPKGR